jgi:hypothetical protein
MYVYDYLAEALAFGFEAEVYEYLDVWRQSHSFCKDKMIQYDEIILLRC